MLIAETRENVTALNVRARADLILDGTLKPGPEITLSDGSAAGVGDTIAVNDPGENVTEHSLKTQSPFAICPHSNSAHLASIA